MATDEHGWSGQSRASESLQQVRRQLDWPSDREFRVLSIDGGGIKGLFAAAFLARLESDHLRGEGVASQFDLIAGTSTGGIIALALAMGVRASTILDLYVRAGHKIFPRKRRFGLIRPAFEPTALRAELENLFGSRLLGDAIHRVCIPSADGRHGDVAVFKTPHHPDYKRDWKLTAVDVALATSAAPTILRVHSSGGYRFIDGGLWANNPAMVGLVDVLACFSVARRQVKILSIGSGSQAPILTSLEMTLGGLVGWAGRLFESMMHYSSLSADGQAGLLIGRDRLVRIEPVTEASRAVHMTDYFNAKRLLPDEAAVIADSRSSEIAQHFFYSASADAEFFHGPRAT